MTAEGEESSRSAAQSGPMPPTSPRALIFGLMTPQPMPASESHIIYRGFLEVNAPPFSPCTSRVYCLYKETGRHMLISLDHCRVYINVKIAKMECKTKIELYVQQIKVKFADLISSRN